MNTEVFSAGACRYLLRNGQFINASVRVPDQDLVVYVQMDGTVIHALTSAKAEHYLIQLVKHSAKVLPTAGVQNIARTHDDAMTT